MSEMPPIIDRLDAHIAEANTLQRQGYTTAARDVLVNVGNSDAPELRAELLRLQDERDTVERERDDWWYKYQGCDVNRNNLHQELDALLKALKRFVDVPPPECMTAEELCVDCGRKISILDHADDCDWVKHIRARENAHRAIANVEGKDG